MMCSCAFAIWTAPGYREGVSRWLLSGPIQTIRRGRRQGHFEEHFSSKRHAQQQSATTVIFALLQAVCEPHEGSAKTGPEDVILITLF